MYPLFPEKGVRTPLSCLARFYYSCLTVFASLSNLHSLSIPKDPDLFAKMSVHIVLDQDSAIYTNLDIVSGRVMLKLAREETIIGIVVKLECESRTRLAAPNEDRRGAYETELEVHKVDHRPISLLWVNLLTHCVVAIQADDGFPIRPAQAEYSG